MRRYRNRLHTARVLEALPVDLGQDHSQSDALARADVFDRNVELYDAPERLEISVSQVYDDGVFASADRERNRSRAFLRRHHYAAVDGDRRIREGDDVFLCVGVADGFVYKFFTGRLRRVADKEFKRGAFACRYAQRGDFPPDGCGIYERGSAFVRRQNADDDEVRIHDFIYNDVGRAGL